MKIILSRKGVDSSAGGFASPVFPDGRMMSIPIPDSRSVVRYRDIKADDNSRSMGRLVKDLSGGKVSAMTKAHVDPDLQRLQLARETTTEHNWLPLFGQCGAAQTHLHSLNVGCGDIFLFFGWFRQVELHQRRWRYISKAPDLHVLYGWMQIKSVTPVEKIMQSERYAWMRYHPHCLAEFKGSNVIYCASRNLSIVKKRMPGAGLFNTFQSELCLTQSGCSRSRWRLPGWMHPRGRRSTLSYHTDLKRWQKQGDHALLQSAARGQEFVLDLDDYPEGMAWLSSLFSGD